MDSHQSNQIPANERLLLLDQGNTHIKYWIAEKETSLTQLETCQPKVISTENIREFIHTEGLRYAALASVRKASEKQRLLKQLAEAKISVAEALTEKQACGVQCAYQRPADMGIDRWLTVLAASQWASRHQSSKAVGILDIGSAITIDIVEGRQHLGGQIAPGRRLLEAGLQLTDRVKFEASQTDATTWLGQSTSDCVALGIDGMIEGYLIHQLTRLSQRHGVSDWLVCGGGASYWAERLQPMNAKLHLMPGLVMAGLCFWWRETGMGQKQSGESLH